MSTHEQKEQHPAPEEPASRRRGWRRHGARLGAPARAAPRQPRRPGCQGPTKTSASTYLFNVGPKTLYLSGSGGSYASQAVLLVSPAPFLPLLLLLVMARDRPDELATQVRERQVVLCVTLQKQQCLTESAAPDSM